MSWQKQWRSAWRARARQVFNALGEGEHQSVRQIAAATGLSKSSVHRHQQAMGHRQGYASAALWELESGQQWLRLLVCAVVYVFGIQQGIGNERLSEFFRLVQLERHIGVSATAIAGIRERIEQQILDYQACQQAELAAAQVKVEIAAGADETFFEQMVLVFLDLASGYIFVEQMSANRRYETWQAAVQSALGPFVKVKYVVSDRAQALVKLALTGLKCPSIADLFHALQEISRRVGSQLARQLARLESHIAQTETVIAKRTQAGQSTEAQQEMLDQLQQQYDTLQSTQAGYHQQLQALSLALHPFSLEGSDFQTTLQVTAQLQTALQALKALPQMNALTHAATAFDKFARQIPALAIVINTWWHWVHQCLESHALDPAVSNWLLAQLLPLVYWQQQAEKTKSPTLKAHYQTAYRQALAQYQQTPLPTALSAQEIQQWWAWADWMVAHFQRTSSPVEGRNGLLSRIHHTSRGLSPRRLAVLTVIHNFELKRRDGSTAAQRLFGRAFPDLFESIVEDFGELPLPRKSRKSGNPKIPDLLPVPA